MGYAQLILASVVFLPIFFSTPGPLRGVAALEYNQSWPRDSILLNTDWHYGYWYQIEPGYVPMLKTTTFADGLAYLADRNYDGYVMFLNEPEIYNQDDVSPAVAADMYAALVAALPTAKIIGPNVWWNGPGNGPTWLMTWHTEIVARGLPLPYGYATHYYEFTLPNQPWMAADALRALARSWGEYDAEIWLPEFTTCKGSAELRLILAQLDSRLWLNRYAFFASRHNGAEWPTCRYELIDSAGK